LPLVIPSRLTSANAKALTATMLAVMKQKQAPHAAAGGRYGQVRRHRADDRDAMGLPRGLWDQYDLWIEEYLGPQGTGWIAVVDRATTAEENSDGIARSWQLTHHEGKGNATYPQDWQPVDPELPSGEE